MKRTFLFVLRKTPFIVAHACILTCIVCPLVLWSIQPPQAGPTTHADSTGGIKIHGTGIPRGIPPQEEIAYPGDFRVGSGAAFSSNNRKAIDQGPRTEVNGRLLTEGVSPANSANSVQTVKLVDTVRSSAFTQTERTTQTVNLRGTVLTADESMFQENTDAGSTVPAKHVPHTQALGAPLYRDVPTKATTPILARLRWHAAHWLTSSPCMYIAIPSCLGCMFQRAHGGGELTNSNFNYRIPPQWGPEMEHSNPPYRFRAWTVEIGRAHV